MDRIKPDASAQFRSDKSAFVYMGGTAVGCGDHPSLPERHWWGAWRVFRMPHPDYVGRERTCRRCGLVSDMETKIRKDGKAKW
jgi:hypothetical protein